MINVRCPVCERAMKSEGPKDWPDWPFCSSRCKLIDLGRWLGEGYRVASDPQEVDSSDEDLIETP